jgi:low affinity Fe/Cu permease
MVSKWTEWIEKWFASFAAGVSKWAGSPLVFSIAFLSIVMWAALGPQFGYSDQWQMIVNTGTTICTFLMVFVIQNSQNRDGMALQIKLDELIRAIQGAKNSMIDLENLSHQELAELQERFSAMASKARAAEQCNGRVMNGEESLPPLETGRTPP